jgi:hypothetical protein
MKTKSILFNEKTTSVFVFVLLILNSVSFAQCAGNQDELQIDFSCTANDCSYSYYVYNAADFTYYGGESFIQTPETSSQLCVPAGQCLRIYVYYDGFDVTYSIDIAVSLNGVQITTDGIVDNWFFDLVVNCPAGNMCEAPITITNEGTYTAEFEDTWYSFTAPNTAIYHISTCQGNACDTKIWVYDLCPFSLQEGPTGTYAYNDAGDCGVYADTDLMFEAGQTYLIRIGDNLNACTQPISFEFTEVGPIPGCMDPEACNFNPLAQVEAPCIYFPDPNCTGPDLVMNVDVLLSSMSMMSVQASNCDVVEGMVTGDGQRDVITFGVRIDNIGSADYYIGDPSNNPEMFETVNCHGHVHYAGYGDYRLMDMQGNIIPAGHKNGFCVMDLCGFGQYNCGQMGISAGCYDEYGAGTSGQWFDITDVPDGMYRGLVTVNPLELPDALGRQEMDYENNTYVFCIEIGTDGGGNRFFQLTENCPPFVDCAGVEGGNAMMDCNGVCEGPSVWGDVVADDDLNNNDLNQYISMLAAEEVVVTTCNDLSANGSLTIYDLALASNCIGASETSASSQCYFPHNVISTAGSAGMAITNVDFANGYIDIELKSQLHDIVAYQFKIDGVVISNVESIANSTSFPCAVGYNPFNNDVFGLANYDYSLAAASTPHPICRIYFSQIVTNTICISGITDIVNDQRSRVSNYIYGDCFDATAFSTNEYYHVGQLSVMPNPASNQIQFSWSGLVQTPEELIIRDHTGRITKALRIENESHNSIMDITDLASGIYTVECSDHQAIRIVTRFTKL